MKQSAPAWSLAGRITPPSKRESIPGPGAYSPREMTWIDSPRYGLPKSPRLGVITPNKTLGPGAYSPTATLVNTSSPHTV